VITEIFYCLRAKGVAEKSEKSRFKKGIHCNQSTSVLIIIKHIQMVVFYNSTNKYIA